jgi:homocysteine S-methyltransferase
MRPDLRPDLREALKQHILIGDGAFGTFLHQQGFPVGISYEELNLTRPEAVADVHRRYYEAGARLIETNTFSATREKLSRYGLEDRVRDINRAAVAIARQAIGADAWIAGSVGSIRASVRRPMETAALESDFREQIEALLEERVDALILETFADLDEMLLALGVVREIDPSVPVICQLTVEDALRTRSGVPLMDAFERVLDAGGDVVGFNCRSGPHGMLRSLRALPPGWEAPVSVFPNAGIPDFVDGQYTYQATPEYFADSALKFAALGARIIGGCCGTTPAHIAAMAAAIREAEAKVPHAPEDTVKVEPVIAVIEGAKSGAHRDIADGGRPSLVELVRERHTVIVELDPPKDLNIDSFMQGAAALHRAGVDAVTLADNSLAVTRMSNMALGSLLKERIGARPLVHIACRDRNLIGTQSHLMGLHALGIDHVLAVTGDPSRFGDLPGASSVYDLTSFEMIRMIKQLNEGIAFSGKPLKQSARFVVGAAFNPHVKYFDRAIERLEKKIASGADFIMTQPVYDAELIRKIAGATRHLSVPIFIGIAPLASGGNAEYLHNEVPGIQLSDEVLRRMKGLKGAEGRREGVRIAKELLDAALPLFNGIYLMTPFMAYEMTVELTEYVRHKTKTAASPCTAYENHLQ